MYSVCTGMAIQKPARSQRIVPIQSKWLIGAYVCHGKGARVRTSWRACLKLEPHFDQFREFCQVSPIAIMKWPFWSDVSWEPDLCFANPLVDIALYM